MSQLLNQKVSDRTLEMARGGQHFISIGNAQLKDDNWHVWHDYRKEAPIFPNELNQCTNVRLVTCDWPNFCYETGIWSVFYNHLDYPRAWLSVSLLTHKDHRVVHDALVRYRSHATKDPGFPRYEFASPDESSFRLVDDGVYDSYFAQLIWLEWWIKWALVNCLHPAIEHSH